ncbi:MAG: prepilin peptidase [Oscillospiraceae bacterium]|jgi:leader peptidase (prepilin peptidase)/N-methyltransferase|nr:prepilin peptidase [Oscillospiraceae bacterium]
MDSIAALAFGTVFVLGITVGSFLNVCILRIPAGESVVTVPSHCVSCGKRLHWFELIPVLSYLFLRGRCLGCKSRISAQYPLIEAANGVIWCVLFQHYGPEPDFLFACPLCSALLVMSVIDARTREIPPGINLFALVLGALRLLFHLSEWPQYAAGFFAVSVPLLLVLILSGGKGIGGGDVKLMAACGLFLGWKEILLAFFLSCLFGTAVHLPRMAIGKAGKGLALGPYLFAGVFFALMWGNSVINKLV